MTDEIFLGDLTLEDDDSRPQRQAAFIIAPAAAPAELLAMEKMHREGGRAKYAGSGQIIFTATDEATNEEVWDEGEAARWRKIMGWPVDPEISQARAWQLNANARLTVDFWEELQAARTGQP